MEFVDSILDPVLDDTIVINWQPGWLCLWDNRTLLHSVTPTAVYEERWPGRRLMMRTAMAEQAFNPFNAAVSPTTGGEVQAKL